MTLSQGCTIRLGVLLSGGTTPGSPRFIRVVHTTNKRPVFGHGSLTIDKSKSTANGDH